MFRLLGFVVKAALLTLGILVLGQVVRWEGRTVSDQVKTRLAQAENSPIVEKVSTWADRWTSPERRTTRGPSQAGEPKLSARKGSEIARDSREIPSSERQKLRELILELNGKR